MDKKQLVLIVDDETRNQRIIIETLDDLVDYKTASSGEEAMSILEGCVPDLVLLDIMMPGIDGYEVCKRIRANPKFALTKVILVSGKAMTSERLQGYDVGADEYMTKPFVPEELLAKAKVFLRLTAMESSLYASNKSPDATVQERTKQLTAAETKLIQAAKMSALGEMAGGVAHEINTPLGVISLAIEELDEIIRSPKFDIESAKDLTKTIEDTVKRISAIVLGLRTFSRDASKDKFEPVLVEQIFNDVLILCNERIKHASVQLKVLPLPQGLKVPGQSVQLSQVLLNLINNSCDAVQSLNEKWIELEANVTDTHVIISITDSGSGIPEDILPKLFDPFFTTKDVSKGTGLGLSISKGIVESHKGQLEVDRTSKNTRFTFTLPKQQSGQTTATEAA